MEDERTAGSCPDTFNTLKGWPCGPARARRRHLSGLLDLFHAFCGLAQRRFFLFVFHPLKDFELLLRLVLFAHPAIGAIQLKVDCVIGRGQLSGSQEMWERFLVAASSDQHLCELCLCLAEPRIDYGRTREKAGRLIVLAKPVSQLPQTEICARIKGVKSKFAFELLPGLLPLPHLHPAQSDRIMDSR